MARYRQVRFQRGSLASHRRLGPRGAGRNSALKKWPRPIRRTSRPATAACTPGPKRGRWFQKCSTRRCSRLPIGQLSQILQDNRGFHIIRVIERNDLTVEPFDVVQAKIATGIARRADERQAAAVQSQTAQEDSGLEHLRRSRRNCGCSPLSGCGGSRSSHRDGAAALRHAKITAHRPAPPITATKRGPLA